MTMVRLLQSTLSLVLLVTLIESKTLPKYLKKCSTKSPDEFSKCAIEVGTAAMKEFIHGDKAYKIPNLEPLLVPKLELNTAGLKLTLANVLVNGMSNIKLKSIRYDKNSKKFFIDAFLDKLALEAQYEVTGKVLVLPIAGAGDGKLDFLNGDYGFSFDINQVKKNGKEVIKVQNVSLKTKFGGAKFELENLFSGNDQLGKEMNIFLNENWEEVTKEFEGLIVEPMSAVVSNVLSNILDDMVYDEVFSD